MFAYSVRTPVMRPAPIAMSICWWNCLLVELSRPMGLDFFGIEQDLSERLGAKVEMFTAQGLHRIVLREALVEGIDA